MEAYIPAIITASGAVLAAALGTIIVPLIRHLRKRKERFSVLQGMERIRHCYETIASLCATGRAARAILFAGHNSGGVPRPESPFWVSALYCFTHETGLDTLSTYNHLPVDAKYIRTLLESERNGYVNLSVAQMEECQLRSYLQAEGAKHMLMFFLAVQENKFIYLTVVRVEDTPFDSGDITKLGLLVHRLKLKLNDGG